MIPIELTQDIPQSMLDDPQYLLVQNDPVAFTRLRCRHDFEFWCRTCCTIKHKTLGKDVPFVLNAPQKRVAAIMEEDRRAGRPIRLIMLKARQWGGSTLIQTYMAWIQSCICRNWNSIICSQVKDTSAGIRGMYSKLLENYPPDLWEGDEPPKFRPYESSRNVREIAGRGCRVTISSIENQDAVRGADFAMAHLSETAFWRPSPTHSPEDLIRAVCGSIALAPNTLIAMESTANGIGNYFHNEWLRCRDGHGDKRAVFVPWYEIEIYRLEPDDPEALEASLTPYERKLRDEHGCDPAQINWYRNKLREYPTHRQMMAEFPTTDTEAFANTGTGLFSPEKVEALRQGCFRPRVISEFTIVRNDDRENMAKDYILAQRKHLPARYGLNGEAQSRYPAILAHVARHSARNGGAAERCPSSWTDDIDVWQEPREEGEYVAAVDVGGRTSRADYSVVAVMRIDGDKPEVAAQWRGHIDHDLLAEKAMAVATLYNNALLAVESNTLEQAGAGMYILQRLRREYPNLYIRSTGRTGFHTNTATKGMIITELMAAVRDGSYIERDTRACDEMLSFEQAPDGSYAARPGSHDDILMTRAIALHLCRMRRG